MTRPRKPPTPPEESGTVRQRIRALLEEGPHNPREDTTPSRSLR